MDRENPTPAEITLRWVFRFGNTAGQNDANRNEHGRVSDDIDKHCPADFVIQQIFDGIQVQSNGEDPGGIEDQRLNFAIHLGEWEKVTLAATARQIKPASASIPNEVRNFHCVYRHKILSKVTGS